MTARAPSSHDCSDACDLGPRVKAVESTIATHAGRLDAHSATLDDHGDAIGRWPDLTKKGDEGEGIRGNIAVQAKVNARMEEKLDSVVASSAAILATHERRKEPWAKVGWLLVAAIVVIVVQEGSRFLHGIRYVPTVEQQGKQ